MRNTRQRNAIKEAFAEAGRPLSAREATQHARKRIASLGAATVYRTINTLVEAGDLIPVELPAEPTRYEPAGLRHHHHFYCRTCKRVFDVAGCPTDFNRFAPKGFVLEAHEIILYGRCKDCDGRAPRKKTGR